MTRWGRGTCFLGPCHSFSRSQPRMLHLHVPELASGASCVGPLVRLHPAKVCPGVTEMGRAGRSVSHNADRPGMARNGDGLQARGSANIESRSAQLTPDWSCARGEIVPLVSVLDLISSASSHGRTKSRRIRRRTHAMKSLLWVPVRSGQAVCHTGVWFWRLPRPLFFLVTHARGVP